MKKFYILLIVMSTFNYVNSQSWTNLTSGTSVELDGIYFPTPAIGYAVGGGGTIVKTTDGGLTWTTQNSGVGMNLYSVYFVDANVGYVSGYSGTILKTTDGGTNWTMQMTAVIYPLWGVFFTNANTGVAVGDHGTIIKTTDGGAHWWSKTSGTTNWLQAVSFPTASIGYAVGWITGSGFCKTTDGGETWNYYNTVGGNSVFFIDADTGYIVGGNGTILRTTNGGTNWIPQTSGTTNVLMGVYFINSNIGYVVGDAGTILKTINGGSNWVIQTVPTSQWLMSVCFPDAVTGFAAGRDGTILKASYGVGMNENSSTAGMLRMYPNPASNSLIIETSALLTQSKLFIIDPTGQDVITQQVSASKTQIDISKLSNGVYFVRLINDKTIEAGKFIKQ